MWMARTIVIVMLAACGGKQTPGPEPTPQVVEVTKLPEIGPGFRYTTRLVLETTGSLTAHGAAGDTTVLVDDGEVRAFSIEVLSTQGPAITGLSVSFAELSRRAGTQSSSSILSGKAYTLEVAADRTTARHADGTEITEIEERDALEAFITGSGLAIPVRDVLVGKRLDQGAALDLTREQMTALLATPLPGPVEKATVALQSVDAEGVATFSVAGNGALDPEAGSGSWSMTGTVLAEAETLFPSSVTLRMEATGSGKHESGTTEGTIVLEQTQTFTYGR
jgi:hypothetical protein